jgi:hypothetical protein
LLRVGTHARRTGGRKPDVQTAVRAARGAILPATGGVVLAVYKTFAIWLMVRPESGGDAG